MLQPGLNDKFCLKSSRMSCQEYFCVQTTWNVFRLNRERPPSMREPVGMPNGHRSIVANSLHQFFFWWDVQKLEKNVWDYFWPIFFHLNKESTCHVKHTQEPSIDACSGAKRTGTASELCFGAESTGQNGGRSFCWWTRREVLVRKNMRWIKCMNVWLLDGWVSLWAMKHGFRLMTSCLDKKKVWIERYRYPINQNFTKHGASYIWISKRTAWPGRWDSQVSGSTWTPKALCRPWTSSFATVLILFYG